MRAIASRVRPLAGAVAVAAAVLLPAGAAQAGPRADYQQMFTTATPGASAGIDTQILYKNPADPDAKPVPVRQEVFTFPEGTEFDQSVVPDCTASELELQLQGEAACPPESRIGGGEGTFMTGFPGDGERPLEVDAWDDGSGVLLLAGEKDSNFRFATRGRREGRVVTVNVPVTPGGPPDGQSAVRRVHNVFDARSLGQRAYVRTPRVCPKSGVWTFRARFTFSDGAVEENAYAMPCNRGSRNPS